MRSVSEPMTLLFTIRRYSLSAVTMALDIVGAALSFTCLRSVSVSPACALAPALLQIHTPSGFTLVSGLPRKTEPCAAFGPVLVICQTVSTNCSAVSRLARGMPLGGELEYVDAGTLAQAVYERRQLK